MEILYYSLLFIQSCSCQCIQQPKDCLSTQVYKPEECRCVCRDSAAADACLASPYKQWSKETCSCSCATRQTCSTGLLFDEDKCLCAPAAQPKREAESNEEEFRSASNQTVAAPANDEPEREVGDDQKKESDQQQVTARNETVVGRDEEISTTAASPNNSTDADFDPRTA